MHPDKTPGWNELHFINRNEFAAMAPSVLQLEVSRLSKLLSSFEPGSHDYNSIVVARQKIGDVTSMISQEMEPECVEECARELESVIMHLSASIPDTDPESSRILVYVADRLVYILGQLKHLY